MAGIGVNGKVNGRVNGKARTKTKRKRPPKTPDGRMPVLDHLRELRRRVVYVVLIIAVGAIVGWILYPHTLSFLKHPYCEIPYTKRLGGTKNGPCDLFYTGVADGLTVRLKIAFETGAVFTAPFWLYQIWAFITPGLKRNERKYTITFIVASTVLFAAGMVLAYLVLSKGLQVLVDAGGDGTQAALTIKDYLSFVTLMLIIFGSAFELPLILVMANMVGALPARLLKKSQRVAIFLIFVFAAVATPSPDPFTMLAMAVPMVLLFEGAVLFAVIHDRRKAKRKAAEREAVIADSPDDDVASVINPIPEALPAREDSWSDTT